MTSAAFVSPIISFGMKSRVIIAALAAFVLCGAPTSLSAQEGPAKRLSSIVGVAVEEYGKAIDARGKLISDIEYEEAVSFLKDAKDVAARLSGAKAAAAQPFIRPCDWSCMCATGRGPRYLTKPDYLGTSSIAGNT